MAQASSHRQSRASTTTTHILAPMHLLVIVLARVLALVLGLALGLYLYS